MVDESGAIITFNGEIYNYRQLQRELEAAGRPCKTKTDTEVILKGYAAKGIESAQSLRGSIECVSAPGEGVLFRIVMPITRS